VSVPWHLLSPTVPTGPSFWTFLLPSFPSPCASQHQRLFSKKGLKTKSPGPVTLMKNNSVTLGLSGKIIK
jgi:hypothetical protein